ncbi:RimJ/RimL family protein N-acetyltransferase [Deinobacterium chartae]|uniref:RimJ/RimL family protein N-acetyltransferase n=1 Tax=Deinobacterium chartae TaxID=521158 RepID=A0A841I4T4_9DEIO|nr:GNAT family N-acetyltransferase [Deinobacterium chartae]MBB6098895.1 RimJ/RimL family protein N-acetyltransferase [Deinobacterium chartae]
MNLLTPRLNITAFRLEDEAALHAITCKPHVMRYIGRTGQPFTAEQNRRSLEHWIARSERGEPGLWAVRLRDSDRLIGWCGCFPFLETTDHELAYMYDDSAWGQGYATEAGAAALDHCFGTYGWERVVAIVRHANPASARVLERLNFRRGEDMQVFGTQTMYFTLDRRDHRAH